MLLFLAYMHRPKKVPRPFKDIGIILGMRLKPPDWFGKFSKLHIISFYDSGHSGNNSRVFVLLSFNSHLNYFQR
jgi:hypothetical protein